MLHFRLERRYQLTVLREDRQVEVVVVVGNEDLSSRVNTDSDRVVGESLASDLAKEHSFVAEYLDAVSTVVRDEDLLLVVDDHSVGELEVLRASELVQNVAHLIEDYDAHHLALDNDDTTLAVDCDPARVLQHVSSKLAGELAVLVVDLDLVRR